LLALTAGVAGFTNGNPTADFADNVTLDASGKVTNLDAGVNRLVMSLNKANGLISGSVTPPGATRAVPFKGAVLQKQNGGSGYFLGNQLQRPRLSRAVTKVLSTADRGEESHFE